MIEVKSYQVFRELSVDYTDLTTKSYIEVKAMVK